jgi:hypothetical protein
MTEQSAAITANMTDSEDSSDEDDSAEMGEDETEDLDSEFTRFTRLFTLTQSTAKFSWNADSDLNATFLTLCLGISFCKRLIEIHVTGENSYCI